MAGAVAAPAPESARQSGQSEKFDTAAVTTMSAGHFVHDVYPAFLSPLLPLLIEKHGLTLGAAGILLSVLRWSALIQPFLGVIADRQDARYWIILAPTVTALGMSLLGLAPNYLALVVLLTLAGLSHAAFHPAGGAQVTRFSGKNWGMGTSFWMTGGELGRAVGPVFIVAVVSAVGLEATWIAIGPAIVASLLLYWRIGGGGRLKVGNKPPNLWGAVRQAGRPLAILAGIIILRNLGSASFTFFFPTYVTGIGGELAFAAFAITVFELAGAAGAFAGGTLSDRFGRRWVLAVSTAITGPLLWAVFMVPNGAAQLALLAVAGLVAFAGAPVQMVLVQELLPDNRSSAMGIMMFLGLEGTILATVAVGFVADAVGLGPTLSTTMLLSALPLPLVFLLPETRQAAG
ncbi:MAG: MFS transporter [Chloroflexi bacterium]|nr:MFS transporter [Chloroflexota bacterium]